MAIKIDGKEMSKGWHYDQCIELWNLMAENNEISDIAKRKYIIYPYDNYCPACEYHVSNGLCMSCPFIHRYTKGCISGTDSPFISFYLDKGTQADAIEIAQLFIDYYPEDEVDDE